MSLGKAKSPLTLMWVKEVSHSEDCMTSSETENLEETGGRMKGWKRADSRGKLGGGVGMLVIGLP